MLVDAVETRAVRFADLDAPRLAFWVGFPLALGIFAGWNQIGLVAPALPLVWSLIYWLLLSLLMWGFLGLGTAIAARAMRRTPYLAMLIVGAILGVVLTRPIHAFYQRLFWPLATDPARMTVLPPIPQSLGDWTLLFSGNAMLMTFWVGGALFFALFIGYRPFRLQRVVQPALVASGAPDEVAPTPRFAKRLARMPFDAVEAIQAEDHYVRCFADTKEELLLYRFADAVTDLDGHGWLRIHRSSCVRRDRIAGVVQRGRSLTVMLHSGRSFAVSERYHAMVTQSVST